MTNLGRLQIYREWQAQAAASTGSDVSGARRGMDDTIWAECQTLSRMLEAGETTLDKLIEESRQ